MKKWTAAALAALTALTLTGCGSGGTEERVVNVCSWGEYIDTDLIDRFEEETGIKVIYNTFDSNENLYSRIQTTSYDVIIPSDYAISRFIDEDMLQPLNFDNIPNIDQIDPAYMEMSQAFDPEKTAVYDIDTMLTNFVTIRSRINRMEELEAMVEDGRMAVLPKKEQAVLGKELAKLQTNLGGARDMKGLPQALFVIDTKREENAIKEAQRLNIPVVALIDTNSDPDEVEYGIPCNDDAISAVTLMCELMADACLAGSGKEQVSEAEMAAEPKAE